MSELAASVWLGSDPSMGPTVSVPALSASEVTTATAGSATAYCSMCGCGRTTFCSVDPMKWWTIWAGASSSAFDAARCKT